MTLTSYGPPAIAPLVTCDQAADVPHPRGENCLNPPEASK